MGNVLAIGLLLATTTFAHIQPGSLSVKSGTVWKAGQKVSLSWSASISHNNSPYTLWYSPDAGKTWTTVKTGIPGKASAVAVVYEWTVPSAPTTTGMIRVFQTFGGTVATSPSNPGDYTLFSPVFTIEAATRVSRTSTFADGRSAIDVGGEVLEVRLGDLRAGAASLDVLELDGSFHRSVPLGTAGANSSNARIPVADLGRTGPKLLRLRIDGSVIEQKLIAHPR